MFFIHCDAGKCIDVCMKLSHNFDSGTKTDVLKSYSWFFEFWRSTIPPRIMMSNPHTFFLDIGANVGFSLLGAALAGHRVLAFEPAPVNLRYLNATVCANGFEKLVEVVPAAVGAQSGVVRFAEHPERGDNSAMNAETATWAFPGHLNLIEVQMWSIDDFIKLNPRWAAADCALMKIDVQGFELRVLEGARRFLSAAAAANAAFTVRAEVYAGLEISALGSTGGAMKLMDDLGFEVIQKSNGDGDVLWRPRRAESQTDINKGF